MIQSRLTLAAFVREEWWPRHAVPNLKASTQRRYLEVWGTHLLPILGDYELRAITPILVEDLRAQFAEQRIGIQTQRKALMLLRGILRRAVVRGLIPANPVAAEAIRDARSQLRCAQTVRTPLRTRTDPSRPIPCKRPHGRCWARTSDLRLVETALSRLS